MYANPHLHTELARTVHDDRLREIERNALIAAAKGEPNEIDEVQGVLSRLGSLVPTARFSLHMSSRKAAGVA
jgi:hypothetical protein